MAEGKKVKKSLLETLSIVIPVTFVILGIFALILIYAFSEDKVDEQTKLEDVSENLVPEEAQITPDSKKIKSDQPQGLSLLSDSEPASSQPVSRDVSPVESPSSSEPIQQTTPGIYLAEAIEEVPQDYRNRQRWLFFHASWCPVCHQLEEDIVKNKDQIPPEVVIFKVDFDKAENLKKRYGVTLQTTFVSIDSQGDKIKSQRLYSSPTLEELVKSFSS